MRDIGICQVILYLLFGRLIANILHKHIPNSTTAPTLRSVYRSSIQFHTWLCVAQITYSTTQIVFRDAAALYLGENLGNPDGTLPELILWSVFVASAIFQLSLAPTTFLNYCFVTSVEEYVNMKMVKGAIPNEDCEF